MHDIRILIKMAARRLGIASFLRAFANVAIVLAAMALVLMMLDRSLREPMIPWLWTGIALGVVALLASLIIWMRRRPGELDVAIEVDHRLSLREKLSTALHVHSREDAFAQAAVADAVSTARNEQIRRHVKKNFAIAAPRLWWIAPVVLMLTIATSLLPQLDVFSSNEPDQEDIQTVATDTSQRIEAILREIEKNEDLAEQLGDELEELGLDAGSMESPEEVKREAVKKLSNLAKQLEEFANSDQAKATKAIEDALKNLKKSDDGPASDFTDALAEGNFEKAAEALEKLQAEIKAGDLTEEQQAKLAEQLENLAKQMEQIAQQQKALEEALQQAGMNPQLAQNPQALQQAIQNNQNLNQQQKQQLQQMVKAQQQCQGMCQGMGKAMQQMAQGMQNGQMGNAQQGGDQLAQALNQLEGMQQMMMQAQAAAGECRSQCQGLGQGLGQNQGMSQQAMQQWMQQQGNGAGGNQWANRTSPSAVPQAQQSRTSTKLEHAPTQTTGEGPMIFKQAFEGEQVVGEARKTVQQIAGQIVQDIESETNEQQIPTQYRKAVQKFYSNLEQQAAEPSQGGEPTESSEQG